MQLVERFFAKMMQIVLLSEAIDGSGKHYKIVFGIILGSGVGGGLALIKLPVGLMELWRMGPQPTSNDWQRNCS